jgi:hypothetical protein
MASGTAEQLVQVAGIFINRQSIIGPNVVVEYLLLERTVLPFNWTTPRVDLYPGEDEFTVILLQKIKNFHQKMYLRYFFMNRKV